LTVWDDRVWRVARASFTVANAVLERERKATTVHVKRRITQLCRRRNRELRSNFVISCSRLLYVEEPSEIFARRTTCCCVSDSRLLVKRLKSREEGKMALTFSIGTNG
jgi:uncharacterized protein YchJ